MLKFDFQYKANPGTTITVNETCNLKAKTEKNQSVCFNLLNKVAKSIKGC